jgi:hypothetical protein
VICYARAVINLDWPAMRAATGSTRVDDLAASIEDDVRSVRIRGAIEAAAATNLFSVANHRQRGRDTRLSEADGRVPEPVWIVIVQAAFGRPQCSTRFETCSRDPAFAERGLPVLCDAAGRALRSGNG